MMALVREYLVFYTLIISFQSAYQLIEIDEICLNAHEFNVSSKFSAPTEGMIIGFQLTHINGSFICQTQSVSTYFGCNGFPAALYSSNFDILYYPTNITNGLSQFNENSNNISLTYPSYSVDVNTTFVLQFLQNCCNNTNAGIADGTVCASVYFKYKVTEPNEESTILDIITSPFIIICGAIVLCICVTVFIFLRCCRKTKKQHVKNKELRNNLLGQEMSAIRNENSKPEGIEKTIHAKNNYLSINYLKPEGVERSRDISENSELLYENPELLYVDGDEKDTTTSSVETIDHEQMGNAKTKGDNLNVTNLAANKEGIKSRKPSAFENDEMSDGHKSTTDSLDLNTM
eukprot:302692_1